MTDNEGRVPPLSENQDIPTLDGWVTVQEAGEMLGVSRQYAYRAAQTGKYESRHRIGKSNVIVVSTDEVEQKLREKSGEEESPENKS